MGLADLPETVPFSKVRAAMKTLGIDVAQAVEVVFGLEELRVTSWRGGERGLAGQVVTSIPYNRDAP